MLIIVSAVVLCVAYLLWQFLTRDLLDPGEKSGVMPDAHLVETPPAWMLKRSHVSMRDKSEENSEAVEATTFKQDARTLVSPPSSKR
jgi:hypothetical protein